MALFLLTVLVLGGAWLYTTWRSAEAVLPPTLSINGMPMGGMTRNQALAAVERAYTQPITVTYAGETLPPLLPEIIELRVDAAATANNLDEALASQADSLAFARYILRTLQGESPEPIEVSAVVLYSRERVNAFLERTAQKYDRAPMEPVALPEAGTFRASADGTLLDKESSLPLLISAILTADPAQRQVDLVVDVTPAPETSIAMLEGALRSAIPAAGSVFAKSLTTGQELCINCTMRFPGLSTLKLATVLELYKLHAIPLDAATAARVDTLLTGSNGDATVELLTEIGSGDLVLGAQHVTGLLEDLGVDPTTIIEGVAALAASSADGPGAPAALEAGVNTSPIETGLLLESIYHCAQGGGYLRARYPDQMTSAKCQDLLARMENNGSGSLLGGELPVTVRIAHAHSGHGEAHTEVALLYGPRTDFVLVAFIREPGWLGWEESLPTFANIGQLAYRYYNGDAGAWAGTRTQ